MGIHTIKTPIPGIFYRRSSPDAPPFATEGATVKVGDTVGLVEIMKSFHPVVSDIEGLVKCFLVDDNAEVVPGQDLVEVEIVDT